MCTQYAYYDFEYTCILNMHIMVLVIMCTQYDIISFVIMYTQYDIMHLSIMITKASI